MKALRTHIFGVFIWTITLGALNMSTSLKNIDPLYYKKEDLKEE